jgi:hypothetical protein
MTRVNVPANHSPPTAMLRLTMLRLGTLRVNHG